MGGIFFVPLAAVWVVLLIAGAVLPGGPMKALMKLGMLVLMGVGISVYGMVMVVRIAKAPRVTAMGTTANVVVTHGKGAHTKFDLSGPQGALDLHLAYSGPNVTEGDAVSVDYVGDGIGNVTRLEMLSGPHRGWSTTANDGTVGAWIAFAVGIVLVLVAFWNHARVSGWGYSAAVVLGSKPSELRARSSLSKPSCAVNETTGNGERYDAKNATVPQRWGDET